MKNTKLRIAQVGSLWEQIPPPLSGGTERVISYLTEQLVKRGHDVTLFACGTSKTAAKLVSVYPRPLFRDGIPWTNLAYPLLNIAEAFDRANDFDMLHVHLNSTTDYLALPLAHPIKHKVVFTVHFPYPQAQHHPDRHAVLQKYRHLNFISISNAQRQGGENLNWVATVYNGIDLTPYAFHPAPQDHFVWIGRFSPLKGAQEAILAAKRAKAKLRLAGKTKTPHTTDQDYYQQKIAPLVDDQQVTLAGELNDAQKNDYFGEAVALLNPIQWNEPFGLTMVESMACGTPVISFSTGAAPELIEDGKTGFLVHNVDEMVQRMSNVQKIDRQACRQRVEAHFSAEVMTSNYLAAYQKVLSRAV